MRLFLFKVNSDLNLEDFLQKFLLEKRVWLYIDILKSRTEENRELIN